MAISLSGVKKKTRKVEIDVEGETLHVEYRPSAYTPELLDLIQNAQQGVGLVGQTTSRLITDLLESWDLMTEEDGMEVPIDEETLSEQVPMFILTLVVRAIGEDMNAPKQPKQPSESSW